jgi:ABC-type spermidine/putrescine transport system permease subunit I
MELVSIYIVGVFIAYILNNIPEPTKLTRQSMIMISFWFLFVAHIIYVYILLKLGGKR